MPFAIAAELELGLVSIRTKDALAAKKTSGVRLGSPKGPEKSKLDKDKPKTGALLVNGSTQRFIANRYSTAKVNLHRCLKRHDMLKGASDM